MTAPEPSRRQLALATIRVASGNFLEMYDFMVFGYYAAAIGRVFFPSTSALASLLLALTTFGAGFLMRPLGAVFLGAYVDRVGRRRGLILTLGLMSIGTLLLACVPGYATLGLAAPMLVLLGRLLQGFSAGVELGSASVYLAEIAPPGHAGFFVSFQSLSQQVAVIVAASLGILLLGWLSPAQIAAWGWRVPLLIGCSIVPLLFILRRSLQETASFTAQPSHPGLSEVLRTLASQWRVVLIGMLMVVTTTSLFYVITAYTPSFGRTVLRLRASDGLIVTLCVGLSNMIWLPLAGALSDRIGRRPILLASSVLVMLTAYPAMLWLASAPQFWRLLVVELWLSFLYASYNGAMVVALTELVPARVRTTGFSLAYSLATCIGGFTPAICTALIQLTGNRAMPGLWLTLAAACGLVAALLSKRVDPLRPSSGVAS
ncbi:MFS transporter [Lichenicola sp.]|uniref:MFS transporter n=1 Tax=Lichenicola sp. TaxID=2804529 RepID=UPI003B00D9E5